MTWKTYWTICSVLLTRQNVALSNAPCGFSKPKFPKLNRPHVSSSTTSMGLKPTTINVSTSVHRPRMNETIQEWSVGELERRLISSYILYFHSQRSTAPISSQQWSHQCYKLLMNGHMTLKGLWDLELQAFRVRSVLRLWNRYRRWTGLLRSAS